MSAPPPPPYLRSKLYRCLHLLLPLLALLLGALSVFTAKSVAAQDDDDLVRNLARFSGHSRGLNGGTTTIAQKFNTCECGAVYTLSGTSWGLDNTEAALKASELATLRTDLWSCHSPQFWNVKLTDLKVPSAIGSEAATYRFAAPDGAVLKPSAYYYVSIWSTTGVARLKMWGSLPPPILSVVAGS